MPETRQIGPHTTWFEEPDLIALRLNGPVSFEESDGIARLHVEMAQDRADVYMLIDMTEYGGGTPEGRKVTSEALTRMPVRGIAVCRAKLTSRVFAKLVFAGMRLFRNDVRFDIEFFDHEGQAREWIGEHRAAAVPG